MDTRLLLLVLAAAAAAPLASAQLEPGFYRTTCPDAEKVVSSVVERRFKADPATSALLLRLIFHDCFANGCDASILIDPLSNQSAEKEAGSNMSVRGYDIIDEAKAELEKMCPNVVSCADIVVLSARDGVRLAGGPAYEVPTGRRDSLVSNREDADNLPGPDIAVPKLMSEFSDKGFSTEEMIVLVAGGHTIGTARCLFIEVDAAPIDPAYRSNITTFCDGKDGDKGKVSLDEITPNLVDANYYDLALAKKMPLTVDRLMGLDPTTMPILKSMATKPAEFNPLFAKVMVKLSAMKVITGKDGEIRKSCSAFNNPTSTNDDQSVIRISSLLPGEMEGLSPVAAKGTSESRKLAGVGAAEEAQNAAAGVMGGPGINKVVGNEATIPTNSVPAAIGTSNKIAENQVAPNEASSDANAAGGLDAGDETAVKKSMRRKKKNKAMGRNSFSMAAAGDEASKRDKKATGNEAASDVAAGGAQPSNVV
ncbi:hypothetical protein GUJ93_ZPchr0013g35284 [Zizania palustris]|uniref:peroxidase n=1 Tax=Zizania palustris TaxID=103762 RepID=A0A8J5WRY4_ZIZPA|nr:hypothetical protein GUJ93_ZPchr0013g35284 [Zizania palustris]